MLDFKFNWDPSLELGLTHIDTQHKEFFRIGRQIEQLLLIHCAGSTDEDHLNILYDLRDFITYHFFTEEEYMRSINYPNLATHQADHEIFKNYINKIDYEALCANPQKGFTDIKQNLVSWVYSHMVHHDKAIAAYLQRLNNH